MNFVRTISMIHYILILTSVVVLARLKEIEWKTYYAKHLKTSTREFYKEAFDAMIPVPMQHVPATTTTNQNEPGHFNIYVRRFSDGGPKVKRHLWLIPGGPGCSTSGVERALSVQLPDTAIYIMDNRGLGHSHM